MVSGEDRISSLPDEVLQSILCSIPLKSAIRTSVLSKRWKYLWQFNLISSTSLNFDQDFSCNQSPKQFASVLDRYLHLHGNNNLDKFRILFSPFSNFFNNLSIWVHTAIKKGVKELDIDLSQGIMQSYDYQYADERTQFVLTEKLFHSNNLTHLSLSRCDFPNTFNFADFIGLNSLSLDHVNVNEKMLTNILQTCVSLENLFLKRCGSLEGVKFSGDKLNLKKLVMEDFRGLYEMEIFAPKLESFLYRGTISFSHVFGDVSKLNDAYFCSFGIFEYNMDGELFRVLSDLAHVKILTFCSFGLMTLVTEQEVNEDEFPIEFPNLQELQLIMDSLTDEDLFYICSFFLLCPSPFLEKLFISLPENIYSAIYIIDPTYAEKDTPDIAFKNLKYIQISHFGGSYIELKLIKVLLENTPVLESLVLIAKEGYDVSKDELFPRIVRGQLMVLEKASKDARIVLCGPLDRDCMINPCHKDRYKEKKFRAGTILHLEEATIGGEDVLLDQ